MLTAVKGNCLKRLCDDKPKCWIYWYRGVLVLHKSDTKEESKEESKEEESKGEGEGSKEREGRKRFKSLQG